MAATKTGLFLVCYQIGGNMPGAPSFHVHFAVAAPSETVRGIGEITQTTNPPVHVLTNLNGSFTYMTVTPKATHILVTATGYPQITWPAHGGVGPVIQPNVHLRMVLESNWKSGTANYKFLDASGTWHTVNNAPVKAVPCETVS